MDFGTLNYKSNLPLDTIEALAWGSNLDWGFNKHPPLSAFMVEMFYQFFGNKIGHIIIKPNFVVVSFLYYLNFQKNF